MRASVLIADDEAAICTILAHELKAAGFAVTVAQDGRAAAELLKRRAFDVAVLDINMPFMDGFQVLESIQASKGRLLVVMITAYGTIESAVQAMQMGASDYITKPFDCEALIKKINQLLPLRSKIPTPAAKKAPEAGPAGFWGNSEGVRAIRATVEKVKDLQSSILITGESGTGKGVVAKLAHYSGSRADRPFVHVDCASIQPNLIESELFGHEKGAFTGAVAAQKGKFELAGNGTVFLDEIGALPQSLQSRLLVVLQERTFSRIGSGASIKMDARVIAATNESLEQMVRDGSFREDLYYRLNIIRIQMPPLRDRREDIAELSERFLKRHAEYNGKNVRGFAPDVLEMFRRYEWPGNIRELENAVECAVVLAEGEYVTAQDVPLYVTERYYQDQSIHRGDPELSLAEREMLSIISALEKNGGHRERTAAALGISRRTLQYKLKKYGLISRS